MRVAQKHYVLYTAKKSIVVFGGPSHDARRSHPGVLDTRGRRDFSRFDPSPREAAL